MLYIYRNIKKNTNQYYTRRSRSKTNKYDYKETSIHAYD